MNIPNKLENDLRIANNGLLLVVGQPQFFSDKQVAAIREKRDLAQQRLDSFYGEPGAPEWQDEWLDD